MEEGEKRGRGRGEGRDGRGRGRGRGRRNDPEVLGKLAWPYIVSTLAPLVHKQWWRLRVSWLDPRREESPLVGLIPKVLVQVGISDFLQWLHVVHWNKMTVEVHELNATLQTKRSGGGGEREEESAT